MGVASLDLSIGPSDVGQLEQPSITPLPIRHGALRIPVAAPEEVAGIGFGSLRNIFERLDHVGRERDIDGGPVFA